jgi:hypothetical protein
MPKVRSIQSRQPPVSGIRDARLAVSIGLRLGRMRQPGQIYIAGVC